MARKRTQKRAILKVAIQKPSSKSRAKSRVSFAPSLGTKNVGSSLLHLENSSR
jgi:hypothetical protein